MNSKAGFGQRESSRDLMVGDLRSSKPGALAQLKIQLLSSNKLGEVFYDKRRDAKKDIRIGNHQ
ncbi:MAG: hypothetical protein A2Y28_02720 [Chlamydiae bacterium GWC2_50_10]|nr:MAG: hypothetical protein A2Z85_04525 [Chlamydiae bacterium GWA2_50_15]OGN54765.1 MAG: hypothetical protein A2Y28_02720 [Chlamydiae bacterium GWC2_50_10]OGN58734.1 MAG: hypothetical protein A3D18_03840 [Chlamydiae bacterium RIFCSPHIGHO2_02_FULL_49_29]OGN64356.1 MAG: hypothetical protein A3E26_03125 [Chlamydiae bacterium RIFCSPHIGHO2_12_FULL_49_32]OGN71524.1 MAG: hypothetical protein A3G30_03800 [Chlamydiae bacterium RIFCSPLOWO2_12_FULL_49_12]